MKNEPSTYNPHSHIGNPIQSAIYSPVYNIQRWAPYLKMFFPYNETI